MLTGMIVLLAVAAPAAAQQMEPRTYSNAPVGMNFLIGGYLHASGGYAADPSLPLTDAHLKLQTPVVAYARAFDAWGKSAKFDVIGAGGCVAGSALFNGAPVSRDVCGLVDPAARVSVNFHGAPALELKDFGAYQQDLIVGGSFQVQAPLGQYDPSRLVNLGNNRWAFRPEVGISKVLGALTIELAQGAALFTTNHDFFGGKTREQDPIYSTQLHLIYQFRGGIWAALNGTYYTGGRTTVNGAQSNDELGNSRAGVTAAFPVNRQDSIKLHASKGISARTGDSFDVFGIAWQHRWGGGL
jgi:Putative MetA-pathway of phenol degradation